MTRNRTQAAEDREIGLGSVLERFARHSSSEEGRELEEGLVKGSEFAFEYLSSCFDCGSYDQV